MSVTPKLTSAEKTHIRNMGARFDDALARATMCVRSCDKLTGLDKVRAPIAWKAALKATGYKFEADGFALPSSAGELTGEIMTIASELFDRAVEAARRAA